MTNGLSKIVIPQTEAVASQAARRLLEFLFSGQVQPGDRIPSERQLTEALGINRPAVREALRALNFLGLLDIRQGSGTYFRDPDQDLLFSLFEMSLVFGQNHLHDLIEARAALETVVAGMAGEYRTAADVEELKSLLETMKRSSGPDFVEADLAFHAKIASAAGNEVLRNMLRGVRAMVRNWVGQNIEAASTTKIAYKDHVPIFEAIAANDPMAAREAMAAHMEAAKRRLLSKTAPLREPSAVTRASREN